MNFSDLFTKSKEFIMNNKLIIAGTLIFIVIAIIIYIMVLAPKLKPKFSPNNETISEDSQSGQKTAELLFFYADWCPHCKVAKPVWEELKATYANKTINGYKVLFTSVNCTEETPETEKLINKYNVEGYPTLKLIKDNQVIDFEAKPTKDNIEKFLNTIL